MSFACAWGSGECLDHASSFQVSLAGFTEIAWQAKKIPKNQEKRKNPLGIGLKNIPFCFSSRICKIVETLTSIQLSEWWNELKAVLKKCTKVDVNSNLAFSYFNYYNAKNLMKNLKH